MSRNHKIRKILITSGEPAGIGPNLCALIAQQHQAYPLTVVADPSVLTDRADQMGLPLRLIDASKMEQETPAGSLYIQPVPIASPVIPGQLQAANAGYVIKLLEYSANACLNATYDALVTLPVQKSVINEADIPFTGHTEFFADYTRTPKVVMMLTTHQLKVALVTTHLPLSQVSQAITETQVTQSLKILARSLTEDFGIEQPRILVAGLNPHAGEQGHLGTEEQTQIKPAIQSLLEQGYLITGPLPADTLFTPKHLKHADAVLCMYHDQGLPTLKFSGFGQASNITLGLPFIRTSVDHGTALDLAANPSPDQLDVGSLTFTLQETLNIINHHQKNS